MACCYSSNSVLPLPLLLLVLPLHILVIDVFLDIRLKLAFLNSICYWQQNRSFHSDALWLLDLQGLSGHHSLFCNANITLPIEPNSSQCLFYNQTRNPQFEQDQESTATLRAV